MHNIQYCPCCKYELSHEPTREFATCLHCGYSCQILNSSHSRVCYERLVSRNSLPDRYLQKKLDDRMEYIRPLLRPNQKIAEIGCAEGFLGERIKQAAPGIEYWGVEPSLDAKSALNRLDYIAPSSAQLLSQCDENSFDLILAFHVLEHIDDIKAELSIWSKLLTPNGAIVVEVPSKSGNKVVAYDRNPEHLHSFTTLALCHLFYRHGLEVSSSTTGHYESPAYNDCIRGLFNPIVPDDVKQAALVQSINRLVGPSFLIIGIGGDFYSYVAPILRHLRVSGLLDNNVNKHGQVISGIKVEPYNSAAHHGRVVLITSVKYEDEIVKMLLEQKHPSSAIITLSSILNS